MAYDFSRTARQRYRSSPASVHGYRPSARCIAVLRTVRLRGSRARGAAGAADYAREERWAQEIVPSIVVGDAVYLATPARAKVLAILTAPSGAAAGGIVIVHGLGVHPDWGLIGGLRTGLADAGYVTLSVQMPVLGANATRDDYAVTLPEAAERIAVRGRLPSRQGHRENRDRFAQHGSVDGECVSARAHAIDAWAPIGMFGAFAVPPKEPVLDIVAETEIAPVRETAPARDREAAEGRVLAPAHDRRRRSLLRPAAEGARRRDRGISRARVQRAVRRAGPRSLVAIVVHAARGPGEAVGNGEPGIAFRHGFDQDDVGVGGIERAQIRIEIVRVLRGVGGRLQPDAGEVGGRAQRCARARRRFRRVRRAGGSPRASRSAATRLAGVRGA